MLDIVFLGLENMLFSSLALPAEMFSAADDFRRSQLPSRQPPLRLRLIDLRKNTRRQLVPALQTDKLDRFGTPNLIFIPSLWRDPQRALRPQLKKLLPLLREAHRQKAYLCATGTGSCLLAEAGLLDGRPATTHWHYLDHFARRYPKVRLDRERLITRADHICCAGSVNSVADLSIQLIDELLGPEMASHIERHFSPEIRRPITPHAFIERQGNVYLDREILELQQWLHQNCAQAVPLGELAERFNMSVRTMHRRFQAATGQTPGRWLNSRRLERARELLRATTLPVSAVAVRCGFHSAGYFAACFRRDMGMSPLTWRKRLHSRSHRDGVAVGNI